MDNHASNPTRTTSLPGHARPDGKSAEGRRNMDCHVSGVRGEGEEG